MLKISKRHLVKAMGMAFLAVGAQSAAQAVEVTDRLQIFGYGYQGYLQSSSNTYLEADRSGTWNFNALALVFVAKIDDKSKIWAQLHSTAEQTRLDWAFIDYQLTSNLTGRVGQIKLPVGLYNEIRDIKFLQLSALEPALYQEASEMTNEAFRGASLVYELSLGGAGSISWDAYVGQVVDLEENSTNKFTRLSGGRATYKTPIDGLQFMASAYSTKVSSTEDSSKGNKKLYVLSADYKANNFDVKAEFAELKFFEEKSQTYYLQAGYTFGEKWTPYARYDYITTDKLEKNEPAHFQKTVVLGLGYKINNNINVRLENHFNRGYALPRASGEELGEAKTKWNFFGASVNFIF